MLESNGISNKTRDATWQRITDAINAMSNVAQRQVKDVKVRRKNIMKAYRQYKTDHVPEACGAAERWRARRE